MRPIIRLVRRIVLRARLRQIHHEIERLEQFRARYDHVMLHRLRDAGNIRAELFFLDHKLSTTRLSSSALAGRVASQCVRRSCRRASLAASSTNLIAAMTSPLD